MRLHMSVDEIRTRYRQAKNPREQVRILSELNCCGLMDIYHILIEAGEPIRPTRNPNTKAVRLLETATYRTYADYNRRKRMG